MREFDFHSSSSCFNEIFALSFHSYNAIQQTYRRRNPIQIWFDILSSFGEFSSFFLSFSCCVCVAACCCAWAPKSSRKSEIRVIDFGGWQKESQEEDVNFPTLDSHTFSLLNIFTMGGFQINKMNVWAFVARKFYHSLAGCCCVSCVCAVEKQKIEFAQLTGFAKGRTMNVCGERKYLIRNQSKLSLSRESYQARLGERERCGFNGDDNKRLC